MKTDAHARAAMPDRAAIAALIPHSGAMCLLERVLCWDQHGIDCEALSHRAADNPLRSDGALPVSAGIEYAAQAMAVHGGLLAAGAPQRGYLAVLTEVQWRVQRLDTCGAALLVRARREAVMAGGTAYAFSVAEGAQVLLEGRALVAFESA